MYGLSKEISPDFDGIVESRSSGMALEACEAFHFSVMRLCIRRARSRSGRSKCVISSSRCRRPAWPSSSGSVRDFGCDGAEGGRLAFSIGGTEGGDEATGGGETAGMTLVGTAPGTGRAEGWLAVTSVASEVAVDEAPCGSAGSRPSDRWRGSAGAGAVVVVVVVEELGAVDGITGRGDCGGESVMASSLPTRTAESEGEAAAEVELAWVARVRRASSPVVIEDCDHRRAVSIIGPKTFDRREA